VDRPLRVGREWGAGGIDYRVLMSKEPERHGFRRYDGTLLSAIDRGLRPGRE